MKWILLVVLMTPSGELDKITNGGVGWDLRVDCIATIQKQHVEIVNSVKEFYSEYTDTMKVLGVGCYQPFTQQEDMVVLY